MPAGGRKLPTLVECVAYGADLGHAAEPNLVVEKEQGKNKRISNFLRWSQVRACRQRSQVPASVNVKRT
jgi:hypothetical protein